MVEKRCDNRYPSQPQDIIQFENNDQHQKSEKLFTP